MTAQLCGCTRPTRQGHTLCNACINELEKHLAEMNWLNNELDTTLTRTKGIDYNRVGGRSSETALPWNDLASRARHHLKTELTHTFRLLWATGDPIPTNDIVSIAAWLLTRLDTITRRDDAETIADQITHASNAARTVVFAKPEKKIFVGRCEGRIEDDGYEIVELPCEGEILAPEGSLDGECDRCGRSYDAAEQTNRLLAAVEDKLFTLHRVAQLFSFLHPNIPTERTRSILRYWEEHDRIMAKGHVSRATKNGPVQTPIYPFNDLREMLTIHFRDKIA